MLKIDYCCHEMAKGIIRIAISNPYPPSNVYLLRGNPPALIDSGHPVEESYSALKEALFSLGCSPEELGAIVYTHPHRDHLGGGQYLQIPGLIHRDAEKGMANLYANTRREIDVRIKRSKYIFGSNGDHKFSSADLYSYIQSIPVMNGSIPVKTGLKEGDAIELGDRIWTVWETPGHHAHHICLYDKSEGIMFVGDAVIRNVITVGNDLDQYVASLKKLTALNSRMMLPGHGAAISGPSETIADILDMTSRRRQFILDLIYKEPRSVPQIMSRLFKKPPERYIIYQSIAAQILQFLKTLKAENLIVEHEHNGGIIFSAAHV